MIDGEDHDERVSLDGLDPQQALKALLAVDPDAEPVEAEDRDERCAKTHEKHTEQPRE